MTKKVECQTAAAQNLSLLQLFQIIFNDDEADCFFFELQQFYCFCLQLLIVETCGVLFFVVELVAQLKKYLLLYCVGNCNIMWHQANMLI